MTKIYYQGKRNREMERDYRGRFTTFKIKLRIFFRKLLKVSLFCASVYVAFLVGRYINPEESIINVVKAEDTLSAKIQEMKEGVVSTIRQCESSSNPDLIYTFDPDPKYPKKQVASFGQYQYKLKTIVDYTKTLYNKDITERQALDLALDEQQARQLTRDIIFSGKDKGVLNWYNCAKRYNLETKVQIIKELES